MCRQSAAVLMMTALVSSCLVIAPAAEATELVTNGDFEGGFYPDGDDRIPNGWIKAEGRPHEMSIIGPSADNGPSAPGDSSLHWIRTNGGSSGDHSGARQEGLGIVVSQHQGLTLSLDIKIMFHNLGGGGATAYEFEYPARVIVRFTDTNNRDRYWLFGWYEWWDSHVGQPVWGYQTPDGGIVYTEQVTPNVWHTRQFDLVAQLRTLAEPRTIDKVAVTGAGWDYEGQADNVSIVSGAVPVEPSTWGLIKAAFR